MSAACLRTCSGAHAAANMILYFAFSIPLFFFLCMHTIFYAHENERQQYIFFLKKIFAHKTDVCVIDLLRFAKAIRKKEEEEEEKNYEQN